MTKKERFIQILKFTGFSISAGVIQIVSYELLALLCDIWFTPEQYYWWVYVISLVLSVLWNFTFNRKFTFKSAVNVPFAMFLVACYYLVFTPLSTWWGDALVQIGWNDTVVVVMNMIINFATEYLYDTFIVFRKPKQNDVVLSFDSPDDEEDLIDEDDDIEDYEEDPIDEDETKEDIDYADDDCEDDLDDDIEEFDDDIDNFDDEE
ncbi:MAG: hypothetical protein IKJ19_07470 [Clostridia bacterium]|nr:hypothetical protein [Clostridia bacterium]